MGDHLSEIRIFFVLNGQYDSFVLHTSYKGVYVPLIGQVIEVKKYDADDTGHITSSSLLIYMDISCEISS